VRHVTGPELLDGVRRYALKEFGPMVMTVFDSWGVHSCEDVGNMVFNLIGAGVFGKTDEDSIEDFKNVYDFAEAFVKPFTPEKPAGPMRSPKKFKTWGVISTRIRRSIALFFGSTCRKMELQRRSMFWLTQ